MIDLILMTSLTSMQLKSTQVILSTLFTVQYIDFISNDTCNDQKSYNVTPNIEQKLSS